MCAQSTRPSGIAQPAGPHRSAHVPIKPDPPRGRGRPFSRRSCGGQIPVNDEGRRRGPAAFDRTALRKRAGSTPAVTGLDDQGRACERHQCQDDPDGLSLEDSLHGHQSHRIPAPTVRAIDARSISAQVKRARFAFTVVPFQKGLVRPWIGGRAVSVRSLALRPRLAAGLPWTIGRAEGRNVLSPAP